MDSFFHGVPCVQEQAKPRNFETDTAYDVEALHGGQPPQEILYTLGNLPSEESRTNGNDTGEDFINVLPYPIEEGLNLRHDFVHLLVHCVSNEVIGGKLKAETATANTAETCTSTCAVLRRGDNIQLVNTEQCVFQLLRFLGSVSQTVSRFTCAACHTADCVRSHIELWNRNSEEAGNNLSDNPNCFCQCDCIRQNGFQNREEKVAQGTSGLFHLRLQNTKLVRRSFQSTSHIALSVCNLRHDSVVTQLGLFSLSHARNASVNAEVVGFLLQTSHRQVIAESTKRLKLTRDTRLQLLESVRGADIVERSQIVGELGQVLAHDVRPVTRNAKTIGNRHEDTLISHPLAGVDTHDFADLLRIILRFLRKLTHRHIEQVHVLNVAVGVSNPACDNTGNPSHAHVRQADFCGEVHIGFAEYRIACRKACIALEQSLDSCRERREASRHLLHLRSQRGNGSSNSIALFGKRVKVGLSQRLRYGVNLRSEFHELVQPVCERTEARLLDALQRFECVHQSLYLLPCKGQPCQARNALTELPERVRQCAKANAALAHGSGCGFQPSKRLGKCVYAANGRCRIRLYFKLQLLDCRRHNAHFPSNFLLWLAMNPSIMRLPLSYTPLACSSSLSSTCFSVSA